MTSSPDDAGARERNFKRLADDCRDMGRAAHQQAGADKYMPALRGAESVLRFLAENFSDRRSLKDAAELWKKTANDDAFCKPIGLTPIRDTATSEAVMWRFQGGDYIDFAAALTDAIGNAADASAADMRQRAADLCDCACQDGIGDMIRGIGDDILSLPLRRVGAGPETGPARDRDLEAALEGLVALYESDEGTRSLPQIVFAKSVLAKAKERSGRDG